MTSHSRTAVCVVHLIKLTVVVLCLSRGTDTRRNPFVSLSVLVPVPSLWLRWGVVRNIINHWGYFSRKNIFSTWQRHGRNRVAKRVAKRFAWCCLWIFVILSPLVRIFHSISCQAELSRVLESGKIHLRKVPEVATRLVAALEAIHWRMASAKVIIDMA